MKPVHERNQECLPPKKRDIPVSSNSSSSSSGSNSVTGGGGGGLGGGGGEDMAPTPSSGAGCDAQGGGVASGDWLRPPPGLHYSVEGAEGIPVDQYGGMLYKVALPSVTYSQAGLHPVLSHISPAYTVPSSLLQHPGLPYPPLGYAQISPHSSLQFVSSPYGAVPYAVPPGFVHQGSLISPPGAIPQSHAVSHLVPYQSVIQEGVVSPPPPPTPQAQTSAHAYAKVAAAGSGVPLMLSSEQQHLGVLPAATELSPRGVPVFYHAPQGARSAGPPPRDPHGRQQQAEEREVNGGERGEQGAREMLQDSAYAARSVRLLQALEHGQDRSLKSRRLEERASPGQRGTPDTDLEVQQVVGRLSSPVQSGGCGSRKEVSFAPLNLSQGSQRGREAHGEALTCSVRTAYAAQHHPPHPPTALAGYHDPRVTSLTHHAGQPMGSIILANGQPVLVPLEYHPHHHQQQQHYPGPATPPSAAAMASPTPYAKAPDPPARACLLDRPPTELATSQQHPQHPHPPPSSSSSSSSSQHPPATAPTSTPAPSSSNPSHFMKGAIIQLATGELKRVEDLQTQDFVRSAEASGGLKIDSSMVVEVRASAARPGLVALHFTVGEQQNKVAIDVPPEHPFFVFGQGWSSCSPERTAQLYGLACHHLQVGDVCVSITLQQPPPPTPAAAASNSQQPQKQTPHHHQQQQQQQHHHHNQQQQASVRTSTKANSAPAPAPPQPMGPPAPQQPRPPPHFRLHRERERERERGTDKEERETQAAGNAGHGPNRTAAAAEHARSQSGYYLHTGGVGPGGGGGAPSTTASASQRRWSAPGLQRYAVKGEEGGAHHHHPQMGGGGAPHSSGGPRHSFVPQEVKLSIEGRSNAGK